MNLDDQLIKLKSTLEILINSDLEREFSIDSMHDDGLLDEMHDTFLIMPQVIESEVLKSRTNALIIKCYIWLNVMATKESQLWNERQKIKYAGEIKRWAKEALVDVVNKSC